MITGPFLRTSRDFPENLKDLTIEINKAYIDIANAVNVRSMGLFPTNKPAQSGQTWFFRQNNQQSDRHQGFRQIYTFTTLANIPHGINFTNDVDVFTYCYGSYTDGTNWYGLINGYSVAIAGQISFYVTPTNIVFVPGAGSLPVTSQFYGIVALEWLSNV